MPYSLRMSDDVEAALAELMERWNCKKAAAISRAILECAGDIPAMGVTLENPPEMTLGKASGATARKVVEQGDVEFTSPLLRKPKPFRRDEAKIKAAQAWLKKS